jgi:hypothetical protein
MKVGVLGSGEVAKVLASGFLKHGHVVMIGSRSPEKLADWAAKSTGADVGTFAQAAQFGELLVLAVKGNVAADALHLAGARASYGQNRYRCLQSDRRRAAGPRRPAVLHQPDGFADGTAPTRVPRRALR